MDQLTSEGQRVAHELAQRTGFSQNAVIHMMVAMRQGRGAMAQFNHPEFAGSGQWMRGGMLMLGDMFNHALKARVDELCQAISSQMANQPELFPVGSFQAQSQSGGGQQWQVGAAQPPLPVGGEPLFRPDPRDSWWPPELGSPSAIGAQNEVRYALFPALGRLAVQVNGQVSVYDTGGQHIAGVAQQQASGGTVAFTTPGGSISLASLRAVAGAGSQQAQSSGAGSQQQQQLGTGLTPMAEMAPMTGMAPMTFSPMTFSPMAAAEPWWPAELGSPAASGAQNELRYAFFPAARRLAVERQGQISLHDTGDLQISGCSQSSAAADVRFRIGAGGESIALDSLPPLPLPSQPLAAPGDAPGAPPVPGPGPGQNSSQAEVLDALAKLGTLKEQGILTEAEFSAKKAELLRRL